MALFGQFVCAEGTCTGGYPSRLCCPIQFSSAFPHFLKIFPQESFVDMCHSVIKHGILNKTAKYKAWEEAEASD